MICVTRDLNLKTQPSIPMSEENESHPEENKQNQEPLENDNNQAESNEEIHDESADIGNVDDADLTQMISETRDYQSRTALVRTTMLVAALAILALGLWSIYKSGKENFYDPAYSTYTEFKNKYEEIEPDIIEIQNEASRLTPKAEKAYEFLSQFISKENGVSLNSFDSELFTERTSKIRSEVHPRLEKHLERDVARLQKTLLEDLRGDLEEKWDELNSHSDEIAAIAREEYGKLTNNLPNVISVEIEQSLSQTVKQREKELLEKFPNLNEEKMAALTSRLSSFTEEESKEVFMALFRDHISEINKLQENMDAIYKKEGGAAGTGSKTESTLSLISALLELTTGELDTGTNKEPDPNEKPAPSENIKNN